MKRVLFLILSLLLLPLVGMAQNPATVTGHVLFPSAGPSVNASVCFTLQNFKPNVPRVISTGEIVQQQNWCITPSSVDGSFSTPILRNDFITPIGTFWRVDFIWNNIQQSSATYLINHTPFNLDVETPLSSIPIAGPNQIVTFAFVCPQVTASTTWTCVHNFNDSNVWTEVFNSSFAQIFPDTVTVTNPNTVVFTFVTPQSGLAIVLHAGAIAIATNQPNAVLQNPTGSQLICCFPLALNSAVTFSTPWTSTVTTGTAPFVIASSTVIPNLDAQFLNGFSAPSSAIVGISDTQILTNKTFDISLNTLKNSSNTAGNVPRNNGTQYVDATLAASDLSNGVTGTGNVVLNTSPSITTPSLTTPSISTPSINGASTGTGVQGTDSKLLTSGTVSGTGATLCTDANGGATTSSCPASQTVQVFSGTTLSGDIAVSASTPTTVLTRAVTMPSSGCPCRVFLSYSLYITTASSGVGYSFWVGDGTNNMAGVNTGQSNATSGALTSASYGGYTTVTYANGANVTFTLSTEGDHTYTVKAAPSIGSAPNSSFQVSVVTSN